MANKKIQVKSWNKIAKEINGINDEILKEFVKESKNILEKDSYVYQISFEYGDKLIDKGHLPWDKLMGENYSFDGNPNYPNKNKRTLQNDLGYSHDPLGIVLSNSIQVYTQNESRRRFRKNKRSNVISYNYNIPLNNIGVGECFGVFGTLDYISNINTQTEKNRDWYVSAGDTSFCISFPFNRSDLSYLLQENIRHFFSDPHYNCSDKLHFVKEYAKKEWSLKVIYIPRQFIDYLKIEKPQLLISLFKKGWQQVNNIKYALFEDTSIGNEVRRINSFNHSNLSFLEQAYKAILKIANGEFKILKPATKDNYLFNIIEEFKNRNPEYFDKNTAFEPILFTYQTLKQNDWGLISAHHLPILYRYELASLNSLIDDLKKIEKKISQGINENQYELPTHTGFGDIGNNQTSVIQKSSNLKIYLSEKLNIQPSKIHLNTNEFINMILLNT